MKWPATVSVLTSMALLAIFPAGALAGCRFTPGGSYSSSCFGCSMTDCTLTCFCGIYWMLMSIDISQCQDPGKIEMDGYNLVCADVVGSRSPTVAPTVDACISQKYEECNASSTCLWKQSCYSVDNPDPCTFRTSFTACHAAPTPSPITRSPSTSPSTRFPTPPPGPTTSPSTRSPTPSPSTRSPTFSPTRTPPPTNPPTSLDTISPTTSPTSSPTLAWGRRCYWTGYTCLSACTAGRTEETCGNLSRSDDQCTWGRCVYPPAPTPPPTTYTSSCADFATKDTCPWNCVWGPSCMLPSPAYKSCSTWTTELSCKYSEGCLWRPTSSYSGSSLGYCATKCEPVSRDTCNDTSMIYYGVSTKCEWQNKCMDAHRPVVPTLPPSPTRPPSYYPPSYSPRPPTRGSSGSDAGLGAIFGTGGLAVLLVIVRVCCRAGCKVAVSEAQAQGRNNNNGNGNGNGNASGQSVAVGVGIAASSGNNARVVPSPAAAAVGNNSGGLPRNNLLASAGIRNGGGSSINQRANNNGYVRLPGEEIPVGVPVPVGMMASPPSAPPASAPPASRPAPPASGVPPASAPPPYSES